MEAGPPTGGGGATGAFCPGPQPERGPGSPMKGPPEYLFKRSIYSNRAVRSKYSNRAVTVFFRGLIDKEIWLVMGSYCHCQLVVTFFFFFFFGLHLTTWVKGPTLTLCPGPLNFSGRPCVEDPFSQIWSQLLQSKPP